MAKLEPMFEAMDIAETEKIALQEAFEKAVLKKTTEMIDEHVETMVAEKVTAIEEEYNEKVESLTESLDGYLEQVVDYFITENAPVYEAQIDEAKTKTLLEMFDNMLKVAGVTMLKIDEAKDEAELAERENSAEFKLEKAEEKISDMAEKLVEARKEADKYLKAGVIKEISEGLTVLETAKFEKLAEMVAFDRSPEYVEKLETIKESIIDSRSEDFVETPATLPETAFKHDAKVSVKDALDFGKYV